MRKTKLFMSIAALAISGWTSAALADDGDYQLHGFGDYSLKNDYVTPRGLVVTTSGATVQVLNGLVLTTPAGITLHAGTWLDINPGFSNTIRDPVTHPQFHVPGHAEKVAAQIPIRRPTELRELAFNLAPISQIRKAAKASGMFTLLQDGQRKVLSGMTTLDEVSKIAQAELAQESAAATH